MTQSYISEAVLARQMIEMRDGARSKLAGVAERAAMLQGSMADGAIIDERC
jgi:hypothetical protein